MREEAYCECGCGELAPIAPQTHRSFGWVKGEPKRFIMGHQNRRTPHDYVEDDNGCWVWQRAINAAGYGAITVTVSRGVYRKTQAHIIYWERKHGPVPKGLVLDHLCRNRPCVNPDHLEPVTQAENVRRGSNPKLTPDDVRAIRRSSDSRKVLAERYSVNVQAIRSVVLRLSWKDIA